MKRTLALIHGRAPKPPKPQLSTLWFEALHTGLEQVAMERFRETAQAMIYYGDLSNHFLEVECDDIAERRAVLNSLAEADFRSYPGETAYGIDEPPDDIQAYWDRESDFSKRLRERVSTELERLLTTDTEVMLLAHSLGAVLVYDALTQMEADLGDLSLVTLGSPLTLPHFFVHSQGQLGKLASWHNISGQGDRICGPSIPEVAQAQQMTVINPTLKEGEPDPHHALGYLAHPTVGQLVSDWLLRA